MTRTLTDVAKVVAAIAVVGIHATSASEHRFAALHDYLSLDFLSVLVNQWARFSVPLFIYLSAYGLTKSDKGAGGGLCNNYALFLKKRLPTILVPYLFFSGVALAMEFHSYTGSIANFAQKSLHKLLIGSADYHLYFLVILAQCYLLFPLLLWIFRRTPRAFAVLTGFCLMLVLALLYRGGENLLAHLGLHHPDWPAAFVVYWLPYFMMGVVHGGEASVGTNNDQLWKNTATSPAGRKLWNSIAEAFGWLWKSSAGGRGRTIVGAAIALFALAFVLKDYIDASYQGIPVDYYNHFSRPSVALYTLCVIIFLRTLPSPRESRFAALAPLTFSVYLIHPQLLRLTTNYFSGLPTFFGWMLVIVITFLLVYLATQFTNRLAQKHPRLGAGIARCLGLR